MSFKFLETFVASADLECLLCSKCSSTSFNMWLSQSSVPNGLLWQHPRSHICQDVQRQRESQCIHFTFLTHVVGHHYRIVQMGWRNSFQEKATVASEYKEWAILDYVFIILSSYNWLLFKATISFNFAWYHTKANHKHLYTVAFNVESLWFVNLFVILEIPWNTPRFWGNLEIYFAVVLISDILHVAIIGSGVNIYTVLNNNLQLHPVTGCGCRCNRMGGSQLVSHVCVIPIL